METSAFDKIFQKHVRNSVIRIQNKNTFQWTPIDILILAAF